MSEEPKFTKGKWFACGSGSNTHDNYSQPFSVASEGGLNLICGCFGDGVGGVDSAKSNASLIASAPELYEALEELLETHCCDTGEVDYRCEWDEKGEHTICPICNKVRAALKKARGES